MLWVLRILCPAWFFWWLAFEHQPISVTKISDHKHQHPNSVTNNPSKYWWQRCDDKSRPSKLLLWFLDVGGEFGHSCHQQSLHFYKNIKQQIWFLSPMSKNSCQYLVTNFQFYRPWVNIENFIFGFVNNQRIWLAETLHWSVLSSQFEFWKW